MSKLILDPSHYVPSMNVRRRSFLVGLGAGATVLAMGGTYVLADEAESQKARADKRPDGRSRLPPGQYLLKKLRDMGGEAGDATPGTARIKIYGDVDAPFEISFKELLEMTQVEQVCDVHCVTKWTVLDSKWTGVRVSDLAARAKVRATAKHVIFEAAHGYTSNVPIKEATAPNVLLAHRLDGAPLPRANGAPIRALVPDLYFWKSAKWLTAIRFSATDKPGYWETRGYHNHADPWPEERYG
jgi:DMSO/TMAO reductase YedYZ molybdopterin-dependent catalytic subunit